MSVINAGGTPANLLVGGARVLIAETTEPVPDHIDDIIDLQTPYTAQSGWTDIGYSAGASQVARAFDKTQIEVEQETSPVFETVGSVTYSASINFAEISPGNISKFWPGNAATDPGQDIKAVGFGSFNDLTRYRLAIIGLRPEADTVTESPGVTRPRIVACVLKSVEIAGDQLAIAVAKGSLVAPDVSFTAFPISGQTAGEEVGVWFFEKAGISGSGS